MTGCWATEVEQVVEFFKSTIKGIIIALLIGAGIYYLAKIWLSTMIALIIAIPCTIVIALFAPHVGVASVIKFDLG